MVGTERKPWSVSTVAEFLNVEQEDVREMMRTGVLQAFDCGPRTKPGKPKYKKWHFDPDEVEAFKAGGVEGVVEYRKRLKRKGR